MVPNSCIYTIDDYNNFIIDGFDYSLSDDVKTIIQNLNNEMEVLSNENTLYNANTNVITNPFINSYINGSQYKNPNIKSKRSSYSPSGGTNRNQRIKPNGKNVTDEDWQSSKPVFKVTTIEKKEGIEKQINDIRICLNKITNKNYQTQCDNIIELLKNITSPIEDQEENIEETDALTVVSNALFDIASNNKFYSEIYADLNVELAKHFSIFSDMVNGFIEKYNESLQSIAVVSSTENYDLHCANNKLNDKRKAMSTYIVNLMKKGMIRQELVCDLIISMVNTVYNYIDEDNRVGEVEEITENVFIMVTMALVQCKTNELWSKIDEKIREISQMKSKEKKSLSSRSLFKYKDIVDFLVKNSA